MIVTAWHYRELKRADISPWPRAPLRKSVGSDGMASQQQSQQGAQSEEVKEREKAYERGGY